MNREETSILRMHPPTKKGPGGREEVEKSDEATWWIGGWAFPTLVALGVMLWGLLIYSLIGDRERSWQYGAVPDAPGQALISSQEPESNRNVPRQVQLPRPIRR